MPTDVRDLAQVLALRDAVLAEHGRVDVLVNNVGHWVKLGSDFVDTKPELWDELYQVNFLHVLTVTQAFLPSMLERKRGSIVNVSSVEGLRGYPPDPVYGAFKAAVIHFTKCLAVQVGIDGVRVERGRPGRHRVPAGPVLAVGPGGAAAPLAAVGAGRADGRRCRPGPRAAGCVCRRLGSVPAARLRDARRSRRRPARVTLVTRPHSHD